MKSRGWTSALALLFLLSAPAFGAQPKITLRYSNIFDSWCSTQNGIPIGRDERTRLYNVFPELQAEWDKDGPALLAKMEELLKKPFVQNEMIATVFLCKKTPSLSMPLLINGNWFASASPVPTKRVTDIIFHELVHTYLVDHYPRLLNSPLMQKYKQEESGVLSHMHLMAIQFKVYSELGLRSRAEEVVRFDTDNYRGAYARAWEIVHFEGEDKFIAELLEM